MMILLPKFKNKYLKVPLLYFGGGSLLPPELQACEWLESDGNSYIDTGIEYSYSDIFETKLSFDNSIICDLFGNYEEKAGGNNRSAFVGYVENNKFAFLLAQGGSQASSTIASSEIIIKADSIAYKFYDFENNLLASRNWYNYDVTLGKTALIFGAKQNENINLAGVGTRFYYWNIKDKINLISSYIKSGKTFTDNKETACPEGTPGMYDIINSVFYTNDGTGSFTAGPDITI